MSRTEKKNAYFFLFASILMVTALLITACGGQDRTSQAEETSTEVEQPATQEESAPEVEATATEATPEEETAPSEESTPAEETISETPEESNEEEEIAYPEAVPHPGLDLNRFSTSVFAGSGNCAACHNNLQDEAGNDVSIGNSWRSAMMANAARDPFWKAKVSTEITRNKDLQDAIEAKCASCHMPMAHIQAEVDGNPIAMFDDGFLNPENNLNLPAMDGVSCALCHTIQDDNLGQAESFSGNYLTDTETEDPDRPLFGPYEDSEKELMKASVGYTNTYGPHMSESSFCATCHTLYTPFVNAEGEIAGEFPEQMAYFEWQESIYGDGEGSADKPCQSCHMPVADGEVMISTLPGEMRSPFNQHHFVGGNVFMLNLMKYYVEDLELTASTEDLETTIERTTAQMENNAVVLSIQDPLRNDDNLSLNVQVENTAGHKLPTGFPSRQTWIHLTVVDGSGVIVFESGKPGQDGSIEGNDSDTDPMAYEPHYDLIDCPDQVQIYGTILGDTDGAVTYTLLSGAAYLKDNRLLPEGFVKADAFEDIAVKGLAFEDDNFDSGSDLVTYQINTTDLEGPFTVTAELLYQTLSYRFAVDMFEDTSDPVVDFQEFYENVSKAPVVISSIETTVD